MQRSRVDKEPPLRAMPQAAVDEWYATEDGAKWKYRVNAELTVFEGHYPHHPIFPGVYSVESICQAAERWFGVRGRRARLKSVARVRFQRPFYPGDTLSGELTVRDFNDRALVTASCFNGSQPAVAARLEYWLEAPT